MKAEHYRYLHVIMIPFVSQSLLHIR